MEIDLSDRGVIALIKFFLNYLLLCERRWGGIIEQSD